MHEAYPESVLRELNVPSGATYEDGLALVLNEVSQSEQLALVHLASELSDVAKVYVVAALEYLITPVQEQEYSQSEATDIIRAAFAAAPVIEGFEHYFEEDTAGAIEYIIDCVVEDETDFDYLRGCAITTITENYPQEVDREFMVWLGQNATELVKHPEELEEMAVLNREECERLLNR